MDYSLADNSFGESSSSASGKQYEDDICQRVLREFGVVQSQRGVWESHWQEIAERIYPSMSWSFNPFWYTTPGAKRTEHMVDSTGVMALKRFGAILDSLLTPRNETWHTLEASNPDLNKIRDVKIWFRQVNQILFHYRYLPQANFSSQNQQTYLQLGGFGSGNLFVDPLWQAKGVRYRNISLGECYFVENHQGIVDKCFRYFPLTARQALQKWTAKCPEAIREIAKTDPEKVFHFIHLVEPREEIDPTRKDFRGMKWASYYITREHTAFLEEGGYRTFPYAISRYEQGPGEVYGRSPAMDLLPTVKTLNEQKKTNLKIGHRQSDPVLLAHDDGVLDAVSLAPGDVNYGGVTADGRPLVHALPVGNYEVNMKQMDEERKLINDGFLVSLFQILTENPQMTATEVIERTKEKGILLSPTIGRQQSEYLGTMIDRELDVLSQQGLIPPMPPVMTEAKGDYKVVYTSPLNRAQRAAEAAGLMRTVEAVTQLVTVTQDPSPLDNFDWDKIIPEMSDIQGIPTDWLRSAKSRDALRQQRQQAKQQEQMVQGAPGAAALMNSANKIQQGPG